MEVRAALVVLLALAASQALPAQEGLPILAVRLAQVAPAARRTRVVAMDRVVVVQPPVEHLEMPAAVGLLARVPVARPAVAARLQVKASLQGVSATSADTLRHRPPCMLWSWSVWHG